MEGLGRTSGVTRREVVDHGGNGRFHALVGKSQC